jgi:hypothetical protein
VPDVYLYAGEAAPSDITLSDPTVLRGGGGPTIVAADANSAGLSTVAGLGVALWNVLGDSAGVGAVSGVSAIVFAGVGTADGLGTGTGVGAALSASVGASAGAGATDGLSGSVVGADGHSDGLSDAAALSAVLGAALASGAGLSTASGISGATCGVSGQSSGQADCVGVGERGLSGTYIPDRITYTGPPPRITGPSWSPYVRALRRHTWRNN